jgi:competence protein ComEC
MVGGLLLANFFVWFIVSHEQPSGVLQVSFLDVGQGDAIYVRAPSGNDFLLDGGPGRGVLVALGEVLPFYDRSIELLIASHGDADHIGGFPSVLDRFTATAYLDSGQRGTSALAQALDQRLLAEGVKQLVGARGTTVWLDHETKLEIISPFLVSPTGETNAGSLVARLSYGSTTFLLTGDTTKEVEDYLATREGNNLRADVLKVSHHGSANSSSRTFTGFARPEYAVISVGEGNRYGHPSQAVLDLLADFKIKTLRTDQVGTITFQSDGQTVKYVDK